MISAFQISPLSEIRSRRGSSVHKCTPDVGSVRGAEGHWNMYTLHDAPGSAQEAMVWPATVDMPHFVGCDARTQNIEGVIAIAKLDLAQLAELDEALDAATHDFVAKLFATRREIAAARIALVSEPLFSVAA